MHAFGRAAIACFVVISVLIVPFSMTYAAMGSISIIEPKNGAELASGSVNKLEYEVKLSPSGNHLHVYIDDQSPMVVREVNNCPCTMELPMLAPGKHNIAVKEATSSHSLTGIQSSVTISVK